MRPFTWVHRANRVEGIKVQKNFVLRSVHDTAQKRKFSIKDFFSKCDQIRSFLHIY